MQKQSNNGKTKYNFSSSSSEEGIEDNIDSEVFEEKEEVIAQIAIRRWVIVEYASKKTIKHYVGQVESKEEEGRLVHSRNIETVRRVYLARN